jgi:hypothetical protein
MTVKSPPGALMRILRPWLSGLALLLLPALAAAQEFPNKPIKLIVPFPAGGPNDIIARVIGQRMSELTKQTVVIDNRGGQAGVLVGHRRGRKSKSRWLHDRHRERERACHQPDNGKGALRRAEGFRADHIGCDRAGDARCGEQRSRQKHE